MSTEFRVRVTSDAIFSIMPSSITDSGLICALSARRVGSLEHEGELGGHDTYSLLGALSFLHGLPDSCCDSGGGWPRSRWPLQNTLRVAPVPHFGERGGGGGPWPERPSKSRRGPPRSLLLGAGGGGILFLRKPIHNWSILLG